MDQTIIDKHREKYPIELVEIKFYSSFQQILGKDKSFYTNDERKARWDKSMKELRENGFEDAADHWTKSGADEECISCIHFNDTDGWCKLMGLPSTVNPIITFDHCVIGMACMGVGKETAGQTGLDV